MSEPQTSPESLHSPTLFERLLSPLGQGAAGSAAAAAHLSLLNAGPSPWATWDAAGKLIVSPGAIALLGTERCDSIADIEGAVRADCRDSLRSRVESLRSGGCAFDLELDLPGGRGAVSVAGRRADDQRANAFDVLWFRSAEPAAKTQLPVLQALFDELPVPAWVRGGDLRIVWCNHAYAEALERDPEAILAEAREIGSNVLDQRGRAIAERAQEQGESETQSRHVVIRGARRLLEITEFPARDGSPAFGYALDKTRIEEIGGELERHKSAHAEILEQLHSAIAIFGPDTRLRFYNGAMCELWKLSEQWMAGHPTLAELLELLRERRQLPEQADFRRYKQEQIAMFTSLIEPHEELMYRPDGTILRLLIVPHPMGGLMYSYEDVTSRLALESSYNTLIAVQRETLDNLAEGIAVFGGDGRLSLWNPPFTRLWRLDPINLDTRPHIGELVERFEPLFEGPDQAAAMREILVGNALDRTPKLGRIQRADGSILEYRSVPLPDGAVLNSFIDVSDSVRVEQALRDRNDALMAADQLKLDFLANVSYQLRTPLNAMIGFSELLTNRYFGELNERQSEYVDGVLQAGRRLEALIEAILDLSSIEAGYMKLEPAAVDIGRMVEDVRAITGEWAQRERISLVTHCPSDVGEIVGDERRLKQVLLNLVSNAIKFTRAGGKIELTVEPRDDRIALIVSDNGIGIPDEDRERVFAPFERARRAHARSGAGVGLALVKRFVAMHGGEVEMISNQDSGTRVECVLPRLAAVSYETGPGTELA